MATAQDVFRVADELPRSYRAIVRDRQKYRVGRIVYLALSRDETVLGFAFPKEARAALVAAEPTTFQLPSRSDERYNWVHVRLTEIDADRLAELIIDAWLMVVPKRVGAVYLEQLGADGPGEQTGASAPDSVPRDE